MNILIDLIFLATVVGITVAVCGKNFLRAIAGTAALILALISSWMLTEFLVPFVNPFVEKPVVAYAAGELAEIMKTPKLNSAEETLEHIDVEKMMEKHPEELVNTSAHYGVSWNDLEFAKENAEPGQEAYAVAKEMAAPLSNAITSGALNLLVTLVVFLLFRAVLDFILFKSVAKTHLKRKFNICSFICGLLAAVMLLAFCVVPVIEALRPYTVGVLKVIRLDEACDSSTLYGLVRQCNFLLGLTRA